MMCGHERCRQQSFSSLSSRDQLLLRSSGKEWRPTSCPWVVFTLLPNWESLIAVAKEPHHINSRCLAISTQSALHLGKAGGATDLSLSGLCCTHMQKEIGKTHSRQDPSFWSYWSICRVCVPVRYPLCSVWFSGQWVVALHSHRSVGGWYPGRCLCNSAGETDVNVAWNLRGIRTILMNYSNMHACHQTCLLSD